jgi:hypothetical protein
MQTDVPLYITIECIIKQPKRSNPQPSNRNLIHGANSLQFNTNPVPSHNKMPKLAQLLSSVNNPIDQHLYSTNTHG